MLIIPALRTWRQEDPWGQLNSQPGLLSQLADQQDTVFKPQGFWHTHTHTHKSQDNTQKKTPEKNLQILSNPGHMRQMNILQCSKALFQLLGVYPAQKQGMPLTHTSKRATQSVCITIISNFVPHNCVYRVLTEEVCLLFPKTLLSEDAV